ncbi:hypothetical protein ACG33_09080 [Steroidobacter denitrificans]|uniref:Uncharacterized protein n=1 Tax=Steroidobacter denitrificans TaxID=465721 RepID=A0A127FA02_STEDE|nr:hypothetical protein ACG33_09080 [Steroidobacter denitrificans]
MMRQIMALFDEYQSKENAKHVMRALKENARQGFWNGSLPPIGYRTVDAERAQAMLQNTGQKAVTPEMLRKFAATARARIRLEGGDYRRDHLRALAQRVEVAEGEVRIMGSKSRLLQTLVAGSGVNSVP